MILLSGDCKLYGKYPLPAYLLYNTEPAMSNYTVTYKKSACELFVNFKILHICTECGKIAVIKEVRYVVTVYCLSRDRRLPTEALTALSEVLPQGDRERLGAIKNAAARNDTLLGRLLLRAALYEVYGVSAADAVIRTKANGKPYLLDIPDIHFGISHTETCVVCAVSPIPVGIDAQSGGRHNRIITHLFSDREREYVLEDGAVSEERFLRIWTMKESLVKLTGEGISGNFRRTDVLSRAESGEVFFRCFETCGAAVTVCLPSEHECSVKLLDADWLCDAWQNIR